MVRNDIVNTDKTPQSTLVVNAGYSQIPLIEIRANKDKYPRLTTYWQFNPEVDAYDWTTEAKMKMAQIIMRAFMYKGMQAEENNVRYISVTLLQEIQEDSQELGMMHLTFEEIDRAVKKSVLGQGKEMFGISVASLYATITDYCRGEGHRVCEELGKRRNAEQMRLVDTKRTAIKALAEEMVRK